MAPVEVPPEYDHSSSSPTGGESRAKVLPLPLEQAPYKHDPSAHVASVASSPWLRGLSTAPGGFRYSHLTQVDIPSVLRRFPAINRVSVFSKKDPVTGACDVTQVAQ